MKETATNYLRDEVPAFFEKYAGGIIDAEVFRGDLCVSVKKESLREMVRFLKEEPSLDFGMLMDLFGMDYLGYQPPPPERFAVIYILYSFSSHRYLRLKVPLSEKETEIDSLCGIYQGANWYEREAWDMFGIIFVGHPNLSRILCHSDFEGHPLRKDYPSDKYQRLKRPLTSTGL